MKKVQKLVLVIVCMLTVTYGHPQSKAVSGIPLMNADEYLWSSRQVFDIGIDSLGKTFNSYCKGNTEVANKEYREKSKLITDELTDLIASGKLKAYTNEGAALTSSDVNNILSKKVMVKDPATQKVISGLQKQNISAVRIIEDVYISKKTFRAEAKIQTLIIIAAVYTNEGDMRGTMPLFYVYL